MKVVSRPGRSGFTLLELLVAISIISIVSAGLAATFSVGLKARKGANLHQAQMGSARRIMGLIQHDLRNMVPDQTGHFLGSEAGLTFRSLVRTWGPGRPGQLQVQLVTFRQDPVNLTIWKRVLAETGSTLGDLELSQGQAKLRFFYLISEGGMDGGSWSENWQLDYPPAAIRIQLEYSGDKAGTVAGTWRRTVKIPVSCRPEEG